MAGRALHHQEMPILFGAPSPVMLKVRKAAAADLTSQGISEVTAEAVRHQGSALLLRTEEKSPNHHHTHSETLFREMLSVHALFL